MKILIAAFAWLFFGGCLAGCQTAFPREFSDISKALITSGTDQAKWEKMLGGVVVTAKEPGFEVEAGMFYRARVRLIGLEGDAKFSAEGVGNGMGPTPEASATIRMMIANPTLVERFARWLETQGNLATTTAPSVR